MDDVELLQEQLADAQHQQKRVAAATAKLADKEDSAPFAVSPNNPG
jgi:hypothetical protein